MKLGKKDTAKKLLEPFEYEDMVFNVKPMQLNLVAKLESYFSNARAEMFTPQEIEYFAKTHITGWSNVFDEDGQEVEHTTKNAILALTDEDNEGLAVNLYLHSYNLRTGIIDAIQQDVETAKK